MSALPPKKILIPGSDFTAAPTPKKQANILVFGDAGQGKSTFALRYAPAPVAHLSLDRRGDHAAYEAQQSGRRILFTRIDYPGHIFKLDDAQARAIGQKGVDKTLKHVEIAVQESLKGNVRTILLDTGTEFAEIATLAARGRLDKAKGDYGKSKDMINQQFWRIYNMARDGNAHLIVLARAKAIWENNEPTGKFTYRGPDVMNDAADWAGQIRLQQVSAKLRGKVKKFELEITKAGVDITQMGEVYKEDDWADYGPFVYACLMNYPGTDPDTWS